MSVKVMRRAVRRWASGVWHFAEVPDGAVVEASAFGTTFPATPPPVVALCGAVLRGNGVEGTVGSVIVVGRPTVAPSCRPCLRIAAVQEREEGS